MSVYGDGGISFSHLLSVPPADRCFVQPQPPACLPTSLIPTIVFAFQVEERENGTEEAQRPGKHPGGFVKGEPRLGDGNIKQCLGLCLK